MGSSQACDRTQENTRRLSVEGDACYLYTMTQTGDLARQYTQLRRAATVFRSSISPITGWRLRALTGKAVQYAAR